MDLAAAWRLSRLLKQLRPDVVHAHDPHGVAMAAIALSMSTLPTRPRLIASRRVDFHLRGSALSRWKYRQVDCFICASEAIRTMLVGDGVQAAHGDRPRRHRPGACEGRAAGGAAQGALAAARRAHRRQRRGAGAAQGSEVSDRRGARLLRDEPDTRVVIAGEGELQAALVQQIRHHHLEKHVILAGFRPDVLSLHKAFDVFVMSSVTEGLGTSLLDAMACARPVVATSVGGIPEVVVDGETGFLVPPRDPEALAAAIGRLMSDRDLREKMGAAGLARVQTTFSAEHMVRNTLSVYKRVVRSIPTSNCQVQGTSQRATAEARIDWLSWHFQSEVDAGLPWTWKLGIAKLPAYRSARIRG